MITVGVLDNSSAFTLSAQHVACALLSSQQHLRSSVNNLTGTRRSWIQSPLSFSLLFCNICRIRLGTKARTRTHAHPQDDVRGHASCTRKETHTRRRFSGFSGSATAPNSVEPHPFKLPGALCAGACVDAWHRCAVKLILYYLQTYLACSSSAGPSAYLASMSWMLDIVTIHVNATRR